MSDSERSMRLMRFWLFGIFVIVFAAITGYIGLFTNRDWLAALRAGFPIWGITAALCIVAYAGYGYWSKRKAG